MAKAIIYVQSNKGVRAIVPDDLQNDAGTGKVPGVLVCDDYYFFMCGNACVLT
jgi:hypothetical protein